MSSETAKYRHLTAPLCTGNGLDIGSQGDPVVPCAIQVELPSAEFAHYSGGLVLDQIGLWRGDGRELPFKDNSCDFVYSSHLIEDFQDWNPALREWWRVLKPGGPLIILTPEEDLWNAAVAGGQPPNCAHRHCGRVGELSASLRAIDPHAKIMEDRLTLCHPGDYTILFAARKP